MTHPSENRFWPLRGASNALMSGEESLANKILEMIVTQLTRARKDLSLKINKVS